MAPRKGTVVAVKQGGGCVAITVQGERSGSFQIDNCCYRMIVNCEGRRWIGRPVEYKDAHMRFLDSPEVLAVAECEDHRPSSSFE